MQPLSWEQIAPGVWRATVGNPEGPKPLDIAGVTPRADALAAMGEVAFPFPQDAVRGEVDSRRTVVYLPLEGDEPIWGLGLQFMRVNHRGRTRYLRVNSDPREDTGESHAPVPFYVTGRGVAVLANTSRIVTAHCASCVRAEDPAAAVHSDRNTDPAWSPTPPSDAVELVAAAEGLEVYVFAGPTALDAVRRYVLFCGGGCLPPRWGLGFWHRVPTSFTDRQVVDEALEFRRRGLPCDVIGLEPGWHTRSYPSTYEWSPERFPSPAEFVETLRANGFRANLWEHPYVAPEARIYQAMRPWSGSHTVWGGLVPDFTLPEAVSVYRQHHEVAHLDIGVSGYKVDECDGSELTDHSWMFPAHATFPSGVDGEGLRQILGLALQKLFTDAFRDRDRRTYGLVRASMAGSPPMPFVLYSDLYDHRQFVRALCTAGISGLLWCPEIRSAGSAEEWVRRLQVVCFSPLAMLNAWSSGMKPWSFPEVEPIVQKYMELRMRLVPYFYSAFARYWADGTPPFRPMAFEGGPADCDDQFMAGGCLLVAPVFAGQASRTVHLPAGAWYEFETGERFEGGGPVEVSPGLERIPVFAREGSVVPLADASDHSPARGEAVPLTVRHFGPAEGTFRLFDDDGESFAFERGEYRWREVTVRIRADGTREGQVSPVENGWRSAYGDVSFEFIG